MKPKWISINNIIYKDGGLHTKCRDIDTWKLKFQFETGITIEEVPFVAVQKLVDRCFCSVSPQLQIKCVFKLI